MRWRLVIAECAPTMSCGLRSGWCVKCVEPPCGKPVIQLPRPMMANSLTEARRLTSSLPPHGISHSSLEDGRGHFCRVATTVRKRFFGAPGSALDLRRLELAGIGTTTSMANRSKGPSQISCHFGWTETGQTLFVSRFTGTWKQLLRLGPSRGRSS